MGIYGNFKWDNNVANSNPGEIRGRCVRTCLAAAGVGSHLPCNRGLHCCVAAQYVWESNLLMHEIG